MREERVGDGADLTTSGTADALLRPALEAALVVARQGEDDSPAIPAPAALRPLLRFARLPRRALAVTRRALDSDDELRRRVVEATSETEVGRAGWLFLTRPEGWQEELAVLVAEAAEAAQEQADRQAEHDAVRRLASVQEAARRAEEAAEAARAQAAEANAALAGERRARHAAVEASAAAERRAAEAIADRDRARAATAAAKSEVDALRRRVAELQAERRSAATSQPAGHAIGQPLPAAPPPGPESPRPEREPQAASVPRPPSPQVEAPRVPPAPEALERAAEAAAHLAGTLRAAAAALSDKPATPTPTSPPARPPPRRSEPRPALRRPVPLPPAVYDDSPEAADHLVRVPGMVLVVDGYNVSQAGWTGSPIAEQRSRLVDALSELTARTGADARVIFDGAEIAMPGTVPTTAKAVRVSFSPPGVEADDVVVELVSRLPAHRPVTVASSDRRVQRGAQEAGANVISAAQLLALLGR